MAKVPVFKAVNVSKTYVLGDVEVKALQGVNLEIYSGEFICIFGQSGCGKSTLLSIIAGLQKSSTGEVYVRGEKLSALDNNGLAKYRRSKIGIVFQSFNLIPSMNILENIALPLTFARIGKSQRIARAKSLLETVGLAKYASHSSNQLSGGQQQRVAIARSLVTAPWVMLADEPTGNLDSKSANEVMRLLISLNRKSKRTVILITHNPEYLDYADRTFFMQDGKVVKIQVNSKVKSEDEISNASHISDELKSVASEIGAVAETETKKKHKTKKAPKMSQDVRETDDEAIKETINVTPTETMDTNSIKTVEVTEDKDLPVEIDTNKTDDLDPTATAKPEIITDIVETVETDDETDNETTKDSTDSPLDTGETAGDDLDNDSEVNKK
ncbi:MAG: ABC transporter ATP-binding protein [bacterium]